MLTERHAPSRRSVRLAVAGLGVVALGALGALTACGSTPSVPDSAGGATVPSAVASGPSAIPTAPVLATVGGLQISAGYVPQPASPDVAAAYLTVTNTGAGADTLLGASSDASATTTMHRTEAGAMVMIPAFEIPAGESKAFTPGADHLMLDGLSRRLAKGDRVTLTLQFQDAGTVTVTLPVTGYPTGGGLPSDALTPLAPLPSTTVAP